MIEVNSLSKFSVPPVIKKSPRLQAFGLAFLLAALIFLPFVILDKGYFIYYGDFNVQQIPFYKLAHEAVRSGDIFWNWYTDLGVNFMGSYSFYLLFSPFFWLTLPFPTEAVPFLMAPLLVLKIACSSLTACAYLQRFVRDPRYAVLGGLLYAFSGWSLFNIFFNHFLDVMVFFPLLLIGVEMLVMENRRGWFAVSVTVCAMVNYWFFIGEVVFVVIYVLIRMTSPDWRMSMRKFGLIAFESVIGVAIAAFVLIPSALALMGNPRTGTDELLTGWNFWLYSHAQRVPAILQSLFFPPEPPARPNFLPDHGAKWASLSAWLPFFSMAGVIAFFRSHRCSWLKKLLGVCLLFALVPGLNSMFILFNDSYYARWFYMPLLLMALATVIALEESASDSRQLLWGCRASFLVVLIYTVAIGFTPQRDSDSNLVIGLMKYKGLFWVYCAIAVVSILALWYLVKQYRDHPRFFRVSALSLCAVILTFSIILIANNKISLERSEELRVKAIEGRYQLMMPEEPFARSDIFAEPAPTDNQLMFWHLPNIQAFHSIVPASLMEFYPEVGVKRDVSSKPETDYYTLRSLLSVRWLFIPETTKNQHPMPGYSEYGKQLGFNIYQNEYYLPMGFGYDYYMDSDQLMNQEVRKRSNLMLRAIYLEDTDAVDRNADVLARLEDWELDNYSEDAFYQDVENRRQQLAYSFEKDNRGFTARSNLEQETLMFFSVPYEKGWSATVNGQPVLIEKANIGFMAVRVPSGESEIRFDYMTPGLIPGLWLCLAGLMILGAYLLICGKRVTVRPRTQGEWGLLVSGGSWTGGGRQDILMDDDPEKEREWSFRECWEAEVPLKEGDAPLEALPEQTEAGEISSLEAEEEPLSNGREAEPKDPPDVDNR